MHLYVPQGLYVRVCVCVLVRYVSHLHVLICEKRFHPRSQYETISLRQMHVLSTQVCNLGEVIGR